ncbi:hypothetical protein HPU229334_00360, partial [Helicobacter pullorum]
MNKYEATNYLLDKYEPLISEYSNLHSKVFEDELTTKVDVGRMVLKVFNKRMSFLTFGFIVKWLDVFMFCWFGNVLQAILNLISPYSAFKDANKEVSMKKCFKDYYFLLKHYKELRAFYNQFVSFKKEFD